MACPDREGRPQPVKGVSGVCQACRRDVMLAKGRDWIDEEARFGAAWRLRVRAALILVVCLYVCPCNGLYELTVLALGGRVLNLVALLTTK